MGSMIKEHARALQSRAVTALSAGIECLGEGRQAIIERGPALRVDLIAALNSYQTFKHGDLFEAGIASANPLIRLAAVELKADCIAAGEMYRLHLGRWTFGEIDSRWDEYRTAARLTARVLHRAVVDQLPDVLKLANALTDDPVLIAVQSGRVRNALAA